MKTKKYKLNFTWKTYAVAGILAFIVGCGVAWSILRAITNWYDSHTITFNKPITVEFKPVIEIKEREPAKTELVRIVEEIPEYKELNDIEKYICDKWGVYDCKLAISIARAESGMRELAFNAYNSNNTLDVGIFQINSIHFDKPGCSLKDLVDAQKNVDCAYKIWEASGWEAWSAYNSGAFKSVLE